MTPCPPFLRTALRAARAAGFEALKRFRDPRLKTRRKPDGTEVSEADLAADRALRREIRRAFPKHGILTEEGGLEKGDGRHLWIGDPVDGTAQFLRGCPGWSVLLALDVDGRLEAAVAALPAMGRTFWAMRGRGTFENGRRLRVSRRGWRDSWVLLGHLTFAGEPQFPDGVLERLSRRARMLSGSGDALGYLAVARGQAEAFVDPPGPEVWDLAAPRLIVEEAGGRFASVRGVRTHRGPGAVASNGLLHAGLLAAFCQRR